jgi:hypothetical protein
MHERGKNKPSVDSILSKIILKGTRTRVNAFMGIFLASMGFVV